jgi:hypothetical protein
MANGLFTSSHDWQNEFTAHLTADLTAGATDIFLDTIPTGTEGCLVIDPDTPANYEIIFFTSKTSSKVTTPANGRGYDSSTASAHLSGTKVIMAPIADDFRYIRTVATTTPQGWSAVASTPNTVTANGNRSYSCVFNGTDLTSTLSPGMRLKTTRTVAAPTQCTSLNGTTQFYSKTSPAGMTFTDDFVVSAWVKLSSYNGAYNAVVSRYNGTSGWALGVASTGQVQLIGFNGASANQSQVLSYQSIPLNKWVHIAAQLDMSTFTATTTTSYVMIDGVDVPSAVSRGGTNPTALVQAGNLEVGSQNGGTAPFAGKIAQVAIYSAKVTQATILASISQGLAGTETSLISAYSFNNSVNDLNANANNLTANGSAVATNADSPFGGQAGGTISSTLDYGIITAASFSTNTTLTVQVPEGCTIPTSGGVSAVSYSTQKVPFGFPAQRGKWDIIWFVQLVDQLQTGLTNNVWSNVNGAGILKVPAGEWKLKINGDFRIDSGSGAVLEHDTGIGTTNGTVIPETIAQTYNGVNSTTIVANQTVETDVSTTTLTSYYLNQRGQNAATSLSLYVTTALGKTIFKAECAYL